MIDATERQHRRTVLARGYMPDRLSVSPDRAAFRAQVAIRVDFQFDPAVTENAFRNDGYGVDAVILRRNDKGRGLVIRIRRSRADRGNELAAVRNQFAAPVALLAEKGYGRTLPCGYFLEGNERVETNQLPIAVAIPVACPGTAISYVAQDRARVASNLVGMLAHWWTSRDSMLGHAIGDTALRIIIIQTIYVQPFDGCAQIVMVGAA